MLRRLFRGQESITRGAQRFRTIWWTFDNRYPTAIERILVGVGMTKTDFSRRAAKIFGVEDVVWVYKDVYGGAWWRITDPTLIGAAHKNFGKVISFDDKSKEVLEVY